ncbi:MAG: outer membrane lipoprotein carrier protein LolA [Salaquimonas sp.]
MSILLKLGRAIEMTAKTIACSLVIAGTVSTGITAAMADVKTDTLNALRKHYSSVPTMKGEFLQFGPTGDQTGGTFSIKRPGKVRFDYDNPSPVQVVSNGLAVMVINKKLKTFDSYPLKNTPLKILLDDKLDIGPEAIIDVKLDPDVTTIVLGDKQIFGNSEITLLFEPKTFDLRQWTIKDSQGKETSVMVFNVKDNVKISNREFQINKSALKRSN